ncbi:MULTISPECIES: Dam family site-specific DNA-(adenine-N6)-methyltransferase [unclassified Campylobacter]|uniref:Dam family site-specific DNA-(adenine-N6)-methyltransferase n=1 Tax=unclassified Campylobacter TaxID=2593542 RepID=UPI0022E9E190|nr:MULTISPECIES: Dam family site-specific DNA-(adenine-N6)-methyltransferase [unclassified Campylobacter]MDA3043377.1 Dam family site-specific DNA-(adenine-N6)-methyltransferase [Campylobacter sp. JMF_09 ED2]MDA3045130.1 Dam family site-specific DNA-(adenine-N6)-methyltransferase [Campylobacter sp. JMF_07 ED4]MDA3064270.1 Dam family site-specific DNA-(adenine-N6)-methyltransferase [Campylobacter sp. JMF_11 EL3]MDA3072430.1 Dam family site-specific DNA-(adenine-N6)-methyltransferase [Campylobact
MNFDTQMIKSPMNYIGGKYKLLSQILPLFPENIRIFADIFAGGCNVGINAKSKKTIFNDTLTYLIDLYLEMKNNSKEYIFEYIEEKIDLLRLSQTNQAGYLKLREEYNRDRKPLDLFLLSAYSFNHQIRFNNNHQFNTPFGKDRSSYNQKMKENLMNFMEVLHNKEVEFSTYSFENIDYLQFNSDDLIYCDPPYLISLGTYNDGKRGFDGWNSDKEIKLLSWLDKLNKHNIRFALSNVTKHKNKENVILKNWLDERNYNIYHLDFNYANSSYHRKDRNKNGSVEVLITNY